MTTPTKIVLSALGLGFVFDYLFFEQMRLSVNLPLAEFLFLAVSVGISIWTKHRLSRHAWIAAGFALAYSAVFAVWTGSFGLTIAFLGFFISNLLFVVFAMGHHGQWRHPFEILSTGTIELGWKLLSRLSIFRELGSKRFTPRQNAIVKGVIILLPILLLFIALFASADMLFRVFTDEVFSKLNVIFEPGLWLGHVVYIGFWSVVFSTIFAAAFWQRFTHATLEELKPRFILESQVIVGGIAVLFAAFLLVQGYALFGGEAAFQGMADVTYAEYARQGFFQLIVAAFLVIGIILTLRLLHGELTSKILTGLHAALIVETLLVLVSAFSRLNLYVDAYGYTPDRLFGYFVMDTLGILLVLLLVNVVRRASQVNLMRHGLIVLACSGLIFAWTPSDALTVKLNIKRHETCQQVSSDCKVDAFLFLSLSEEAYPTIKAFLDAATEDEILGSITPSDALYPLPCEAVYARETLSSFYLNQLFDFNGQTLGWEWQEWNFSRVRLPNRYLDDPALPTWMEITPVEGCP